MLSCFYRLPENDRAIAAAKRLLSGRSGGSLLICGPTGTGKSALCTALLTVPSTHQQVSADLACVHHLPRLLSINDVSKRNLVLNRSMEIELSSASILALDDIDRLAEAHYSALSTILAARNALRLPTVLTTTLEPNRLPRRLRSRLSECTIERLQPLSVDSRGKLVRQLYAAYGMELAEDAVQFLASRDGGIAELQAELTAVLDADFPAPICAWQLHKLLAGKTVVPAKLVAGRVLERVASLFSIEVSDIIAGTEPRSGLLARDVAMTLVADLTTLSMSDIGSQFAKRLPASVRAAISRLRRLEMNDPMLKRLMDKLRSQSWQDAPRKSQPRQRAIA